MFKKISRHILYHYILPYGGLMLVKLISLTYKITFINPEKESDILKNNGSLVYASWHQRFFPGITFFSKRKPIAIMISQSRDGEFIARIVKILGWHPVRGSSTRGGNEAMQKLNKLAIRGYKIGHIVDGPKGPFGVVKPGLLKIAQVSGAPVVPTITSAEKCWIFRSWDRFMVPKPFSRIIIRFGDAIDVRPDLTKEEFEKRRLQVEQNLQTLYEETDRIWKNPEKITEIFQRP